MITRQAPIVRRFTSSSLPEPPQADGRKGDGFSCIERIRSCKTRYFSPARLYAILDAGSCARRGFGLLAVADAWKTAGIRLIQYRDKQATDAEVLRNALALRDHFAGTGATLILNDRVHLFTASGFDGVHIGQGDGGVRRARELIGPDPIVGLSTHDSEQVLAADAETVSYIAIGPVYATGTKSDAQPVVGMEGVRTARSLTRKPLVAIGGISAATAPSVLEAGADAVAVISALLDGEPGNAAAQFLRGLASS